MKTMYVSLATLSVLLSACGGGGSNAGAPTNQAPTITSIDQQNSVANTPGAPISFKVNDEQLSTLSLSATSDRQQVVTNEGLSLAGNGSERTITVTPVDDVTGDALITIVATDVAGLSASTSFLLVVDPEQQSMQKFAREEFLTDSDDDPVPINAIEFVMDADTDDFADLLAE